MCFVGPNCPASVSASASSLAFCSCSFPSFYCLSFYLHIYKWSTYPHTHTLILAPIHTLAKTHIKCVLRFWLAGNTFFWELSGKYSWEKEQKEKCLFHLCHLAKCKFKTFAQFRFCLKKGHFIFIKETKKVPLDRGKRCVYSTMEHPAPVTVKITLTNAELMKV